MKKICVVIVTYNRKEYLLKLIKSLLNQTYKIDSILIFDNYGSDNTGEYLKINGIIDDFKESSLTCKMMDSVNIYFYRNNENSGGSGGFHDSMKMACELKKDFDFLWCMDDDVDPQNTCLEKLVESITSESLITVPNRNDSQFTDRPIVKVDLRNPIKFRKIKKSLDPARINTSTVKVVDCAFEGPLISTKLINNIGYMDKRYFIFYDDTDFSYRASKYTNILYCMDAHLYKQIYPKNIKTRFYSWRDYYMIRNRIVFELKYGNNIVKMVRPKLYLIWLLFENIVKLKFKNLKVIILAYEDAVKNNIGKTIDPSVGIKL